MALPPLQCGEMGAFYRILGPMELSAAIGYTTGRPFPLVLRHSSHGERFRTARVGEQVLEGTHLPPPALLYCLHDTGLKPTHGLVDSPPINRMPVHRVVGGRTSNHLRL